MDGEMKVWSFPEIEIVGFNAEDVIRTSAPGITKSGFGDKTTWDDLFGDV